MPNINKNLYEVQKVTSETVHVAEILIPADGDLPQEGDTFQILTPTAIRTGMVKELKGITPTVDDSGNKSIVVKVTFVYFPNHNY